jgi:multiple sugar transport system substrate-binding protein
MKARHTRLLVATCCLILPLACGTRQDEQASRPPQRLDDLDPTGAEVIFWYQHSREREDELLALIDEFNRSNDYGITVKGEYAGGYNDIYNKMIVGLQSGSVPDLLVAYQNQARAYFGAEGVVDLQPYIESASWGITEADRSDFFSAFLQQDRVGAAQICFPPNRSMEVLYYNASWLDELGFAGPPTTWEEFATMCRVAHDRPFSKSADKSRSLGFMLEIDASRMASMVFSRGGSFVNQDQTAYTLNTPEMAAALQMMRELTSEGAVAVVGEDYGDQKEFSVGQVLFNLRSSSGLPFYRSAVEQDGVGFAWDVTHPPHGPAGPVVNVYGASLAVGRTTPERQLAAWLFVRWFTQSAQQARWVRISNYFPVRKSTAQALTDYFEQSPQYRSAYDLLDYGRSEPSVEGYQHVRRMIQDAVVAALNGEDTPTVLARLEAEANRALRERM